MIRYLKINGLNLYNVLDGLLPLMFILTIYIMYSQKLFLWGVMKFFCIGFSFLWIALFFKKVTNVVFKNYFLAFVLFQVFLIVPYIYNDRPVGCFFSEFSNFVLPMMFVFVGMTDSRPNTSFYDKLMYVAAIVFVLGILCYVISPHWYVDSMLNARNNTWFARTQHTEKSILYVMRFPCFFQDSYPVSHYSIFCLSIALFNMLRVDVKKRFANICFFIALLAAFLCLHRVAMAYSIVLMMFFLFYCIKENENVAKKIGFLPVLGIVLFLLMGNQFGDRLIQIDSLLSNRVDDNMSIVSAISERKMTTELLSEMTFFTFGHGLGAGGASARMMKFVSVTDMNYVKMFYESGFFGTGAFLALIFFTLKRAFAHYKIFAIEIMIIVFILIAMTGSNSLCLYYMYIIPFWYAVGKVWNDSYLSNASIRNIRLK